MGLVFRSNQSSVNELAVAQLVYKCQQGRVGVRVSNCTTDITMVTDISRVGKEKINLAIVLIDTNSVLQTLA